jgi:hypothetical protein
MAPTFRRHGAMALLTTASALVAPRPLTARPRRPTMKATPTMGLKDTIGNIFVPPPPPPPVTVVEGAENFRLLGVPPNAEYAAVWKSNLRRDAVSVAASAPWRGAIDATLSS